MWIVTAVVFIINLSRFGIRAGNPVLYIEHFRHPVTGPFVALAPATAMLLGDRIFADHVAAGRIVVIASFGAAVVLAWFLVGAALVARPAFFSPLPDALVPTMAIFAAPPVVAVNAWFAITAPDSPDDRIQIGLLGISVLLIGSQLMLIPRYRMLQFSLAFWSFTFTTAAASTYGIHRLALTSPPGATAWIWILFAVATTVIGGIAARSFGLLRGDRPTGAITD